MAPSTGIYDMISRLFDRLRGLGRDRRGNVALVFAMYLLPLIAGIGCAIDYGRAVRIKIKFEGAADAASVGSISMKSRAYTEARLMSSDSPMPDGVTDATNIFAANVASVIDYSSNFLTPVVTLTAGSLTSSVQFTAQVPTVFMKLFGMNTMTVSGTSVATNAVIKIFYADFYLLLDNSPSMGIGATATDISNLYSHTTNTADGNCGFACHITDRPLPVLSNGNVQKYDNYEIARYNKITLRFDEVVTATTQVLGAAMTAEAAAGAPLYRFGIYDYGATADTIGLTKIYPTSSDPVSSDLESAQTAAADPTKLALMTVSWWGDNDDSDTPHNAILPAINAIIPTPGSGITAATPQEFVFIISDGVSDENNSSCSTATTQPPASYPTDTQGDGSARCSMPIDPALCQSFKDRGVKVGVLYTTYFSLATPDYPITDQYYQQFVMPYNPGPYQPSLNSQIAKNMQACASPGLYFEISPTLDIPTALQELFNAARSTIGPHLKS